MRRRLITALAVLLALAGVTVVLWKALDWPPPGMILRYGLSYGCEPTGETRTFEGVEFVEIGPGCFRMGSGKFAKGGDLLGKVCAVVGLPWGEQPEPETSDEMPVHWVEFRKGFWISRYEVTNEQYEAFDLKHERSDASPGDRAPVVQVSWEDAKKYCAWLSEKSGLALRLPSESEWECACRSGSRREFCFGDDEKLLERYGWFDANSGGRAREVGTRQGNDWGLHDFHGNVCEWCEDTYHLNYVDARADGTAWTEGGEEWEVGTLGRVLRGGDWRIRGMYSRSALRIWYPPSGRSRGLGFRPAFTSPDGRSGYPE